MRVLYMILTTCAAFVLTCAMSSQVAMALIRGGIE